MSTARQPFAFTYAGFVLDGTDEFGCEWTTSVADGWFSSAKVRGGGGSDRSGQDGAWGSTPLRTARIVRLAGRVRTTDGIGVLELAMRRFAALPVVGELACTSTVLTLSGAAQIEDAPDTSLVAADNLAGPRQATWQVTVRLPDPLLYGPETFLSTGLDGVAGTGRVWPRVWPRDWGIPAGETPGSIEVPNDGTAPYWPRLRIDGPVPNPVVTLNETGDWVRFNGSLGAGQWLDFDLANRRVLLNGQVSLRQFVTSSGRWLMVPPGGGSVSWAADGADPAATLSVWSYEGAWS